MHIRINVCDCNGAYIIVTSGLMSGTACNGFDFRIHLPVQNDPV